MIKMKKINDQGIVSIIFTMTMILIMTLVVLAMSHNSIKEQRQSLDRQLSDQAYYNAESGISDWANYLYTHAGAKSIKDDCNTSPSDYPGTLPEPDITDDGNDKYTCVMYDKAPTSIEYSNLEVGSSKVVPITPTTGGLGDLTIEWTGSGSGDWCGMGPGNNLSKGGNCKVGGMRIELVPTTGSRDSLRSGNFVAFAVPWGDSHINQGGTIGHSDGVGADNQGARRPRRPVSSVQPIARCDDNDKCQTTISGINLPEGDSYMLHIMPLYETATIVKITGTQMVGSASANFNNAQYMLDVTGKSADVLRRVKVRLPANGSSQNIDYTLRTADDICKLMSIDTDTHAIDRGGCSD